MQTEIDRVRSFWDSRPCNIRHSSQPVGTKKYFDEVEARKYFVEPHIPKFADFTKWRDKQVLEIGCGIGTDAINFARNKALYTGVELSTESLRIAQQRFKIFDLNGTLLNGNAELIDELFPGRTFDLIYSFGVLHHTPDISKAFRAIRKLTNSGTTFKFMVYAKHSWKNALINAGLEQPEAQFGCPIANVYSDEGITELLADAGFKVTSIIQDHIFPYNIDKYRNYEFELEPWFAEMSKAMRGALEQQLGWHLLITAIPFE
jgi:ubiquinone/menaquinone biosynthesis C-methylase UbiE